MRSRARRVPRLDLRIRNRSRQSDVGRLASGASCAPEMSMIWSRDLRQAADAPWPVYCAAALFSSGGLDEAVDPSIVFCGRDVGGEFSAVDRGADAVHDTNGNSWSDARGIPAELILRAIRTL